MITSDPDFRFCSVMSPSLLAYNIIMAQWPLNAQEKVTYLFIVHLFHWLAKSHDFMLEPGHLPKCPRTGLGSDMSVLA